MKATLIDKVSLTLDETRLVMLGAQVLLGFQFEAFFLEEFGSLPRLVQELQLLSLLLLMAAVVLIIGPVTFDLIVCRGNAARGTQRYANLMIEAALLPFAAGIFLAFLGCSWATAGALPASVLAGTGFLATGGLWFLYPRWLRARFHHPAPSLKLPLMQRPEPTPLPIRMRDILTEARIILPGAQALLGFQMVIFLSKAFQALPAFSRGLHLVAVCLLLASVVLLMAPPAYHRIVEDGEETERLYHFCRRVVLWAAVPFGLSLACDLYVVAGTVLPGVGLRLALSIMTAILCAACWYGYPVLCRRRLDRKKD
jgi:hypothetical protein